MLGFLKLGVVVGGGRFQLLQFLPSLVVRRDEPAAPLADAAQRQIRSISLPLLRRERLLYRRGRRCSFLNRRCSCSRGRRRTDNPDPWRLPSEVPPPCAAASSHFLRRKFFLKRLKQGPGPGQSRALSPQPNGPGQPREAAPRKSRRPRNARPCVWCGRALVLHAMPSLSCRGLPWVRSVARATDRGSGCFATPGGVSAGEGPHH